MTDTKPGASKALELIMLQRAKQQAYWLLALQATELQGEYFEQATIERKILTNLIDMAIATGLLNHHDVDIWNIRLIEQTPE